MAFVILILLGLSFGSFVNALVWRLHEQSKTKKQRVATDEALTITKGRSMCPDCQHELSVTDLVPVLSWISLRGKCRYCHKPIHWQYPLVEIATAGLFVLSYIYWPHGFDAAGTVAFVTWLVSLVGFMALIVYDLRWMILPNKIVLPLTVLATASIFVQSIVSQDFGLIVKAGLGLAVAGGLFYVLFQISNGKWIGGGDVKLGFVLGLLLAHPGLSFLMLFVASTLGTLYALPLLLTGRMSRKSRLPFGPFLIVSTIIVQLFGALIFEWYKVQFVGY